MGSLSTPVTSTPRSEMLTVTLTSFLFLSLALSRMVLMAAVVSVSPQSVLTASLPRYLTLNLTP